MSEMVGLVGVFVLKVQRVLIALAGVTLATLMVVQTLIRYWFETPFLGIEETAVLLGLWLYFLGSSYATRIDAHIKGGVAGLFIKNPRILTAVKLGGTLVCLAISILFVAYAGAYLLSVWESGRRSTYLGWPTIIWVVSMVVGFVLMSSYLALQALNELSTLRSRERLGTDQ